MLSGISVICFGASYAIALMLEVSKLFTQSSWRHLATLGITAAGFFAQSVFLGFQLRDRAVQGQPIVNWYTGCLLLSWVLSLTFLGLLWANRKSASGFLLLPTSLAMIIVAHLFPSTPRALQRWNLLHGISLAFGMTLVIIGCIAGLMYLFQSNRLKNKKLPIRRVWLPSLERLQKLNERCLLTSVGLLGFGLVSGILLNLVRNEDMNSSIPWSDPVVVASLVWLAWLVCIVVFHSVYRPARHGRKVAYMTIGSFVFLGIVLVIVWWMPSRHAAVGSTASRVPIRESSGTTQLEHNGFMRRNC